jgi:hypothetical protein
MCHGNYARIFNLNNKNITINWIVTPITFILDILKTQTSFMEIGQSNMPIIKERKNDLWGVSTTNPKLLG